MIGLALVGLALVGLIVRTNYLIRKAKQQRLRNALQAWVDELVDLYSEDDEPTA